MAKIIYKNGYAGQNKLSCIKGIEIELLNGQKALIYPRYAERRLLTSKQRKQWGAEKETEVVAMKRTSTAFETECLLGIGSPAAEWVSQFKYGKYSNFALPSLLAAMEIQQQKADIDALAETIEGADLLRKYISSICSCSWQDKDLVWCVDRCGYCSVHHWLRSCLAVPTIIYK